MPTDEEQKAIDELLEQKAAKKLSRLRSSEPVQYPAKSLSLDNASEAKQWPLKAVPAETAFPCDPSKCKTGI